MSADLWAGIAIGLLAPWILMLAILRSRDKATKEQLEKADRPNVLLEERNAIGHEQLAALWRIAGMVAPRDTHKARRERIVVQMVAASFADPKYSEENAIRHGISCADALIAELDKLEPPAEAETKPFDPLD